MPARRGRVPRAPAQRTVPVIPPLGHRRAPCRRRPEEDSAARDSRLGGAWTSGGGAEPGNGPPARRFSTVSAIVAIAVKVLDGPRCSRNLEAAGRFEPAHGSTKANGWMIPEVRSGVSSRRGSLRLGGTVASTRRRIRARAHRTVPLDARSTRPAGTPACSNCRNLPGMPLRSVMCGRKHRPADGDVQRRGDARAHATRRVAGTPGSGTFSQDDQPLGADSVIGDAEHDIAPRSEPGPR